MSISSPLNRWVRAISTSSLWRPKIPIALGLRFLYMDSLSVPIQEPTIFRGLLAVPPTRRPPLSRSGSEHQPGHPPNGRLGASGLYFRIPSPPRPSPPLCSPPGVLMHFSLWQVLVLAVVQGITEFLPISSDGHLAIIAPLLFGSTAAPPHMMDLTIVLHMGTLGSILIYYRGHILRLLNDERRVFWLICLGTLPAVAVVLIGKIPFEKWFEPLLESPLLAGLMLPVTGGVLIWSLRQAEGRREYRELTVLDSLLIGTAQAAAILPGLSRSGSTIAAGLFRRMSRPAAATYSFLLAIPALAGAGAYYGLKILKAGEGIALPAGHLVIGAAVSFGVGLVALSWLNQLLQHGKLHWFGWYSIALGIVVTIWQLAALRSF